MIRSHRRWLPAAAVALLSAAWAPEAPGQELSKFERERARMMLNIVKKDLVAYYYDERFHDVKLDDAFKAANDKIDQAKSVSQLMAAIARPLLELNDSHTIFIPPGRAARLHYGWHMQMVGDRCYVTAVQDGSDAASKGLKKGDLVLEVDGHKPTRLNRWGMQYVYRVLAPRSSLPIVVQGPDGQPRRMEVAAKVDVKRRLKGIREILREDEDREILSKDRFVKVGDGLVIWKMPEFDMSVDDVRNEMDRVNKRPAFILDLRGNPGGAVENLEAMIGVFVGPKTMIGKTRGREPQRPIVAKRAGPVYAGTLVVLVDSDSASASELFARMMQLSGRAKVIGDRTAGFVMESRVYSHMIGDNSGIFFGANMTIADIIMSDGKSLEHVGVTPDETILPTAEDLAAGRDPVLSRAAVLCGVSIDAETAGGYFPFVWID